MNFQQLRSVRETVRSGFNLTDAADVLCTSQSGVSRQLRELEEELGIAIFERHGKRLVGLTLPGQEILRIIERILVERDNLKDAATDFLGLDNGRLTVASTHAQSRYRLPGVVEKFRNAYPGVKLALHQTSPAQIVEMVRDGRADLGFATESLSGQSDFVLFKAYTWRHRVIAPLGHPLTLTHSPSLSDVAAYPIITYEEGMTGRGKINEAFRQAGVNPNIVLTAIDSDVIKTYVELRLGVGIIAEMAYSPERDSGIVCVSSEGWTPENHAYIAVRRGNYLRGFAVDFIRTLIPDLSEADIRAALGTQDGKP